MTSGYPNLQQAIGRSITSQNRDESSLVREIATADDENKDLDADVGDRDADKRRDRENNESSKQSIGNSRQTARDPLIQFHYNVNNNNNNNNDDDIKNQSQSYPNELISFFNKENFERWNHYDNGPEKDDIQEDVFPEEIIFDIFNKTKNKTFVPVMPPECHGQTFCEYTPDYPEDIIREEIKAKSYLKQYASKENPLMVSQRISIGRDHQYLNLCNSSTGYFYPQVGMTSDGTHKFIMQSPDLNQWFEAEICNEEDKPCSVKYPTETKNSNTTCVQKYISHPFACLSHEGQGETDWFQIQSSCCCYIT